MVGTQRQDGQGTWGASRFYLCLLNTGLPSLSLGNPPGLGVSPGECPQSNLASNLLDYCLHGFLLSVKID